MSAISSSSASTSAASGSGLGDKYSEMTSGDFLKVMFAELNRQDPLQPSETKDLLAQISTIRSIESNLSLTDNLKQMVKQNEASGAGNLVGQMVRGVDANGEPLEGVVRSVRISREGTTLNLVSGKSIEMKNLQEILGFMLEDAPPARGGADAAEPARAAALTVEGAVAP
ncbi:MAG: flagellar hook capping FlgD N-terminal domain-containing protein [Phycisphaerales bacterium]